jgi:hypothetical protein
MDAQTARSGVIVQREGGITKEKDGHEGRLSFHHLQ